jgi:hypothetical protein
MSETTYTPDAEPDLCPQCRTAIRETRHIGLSIYALPCWHRQGSVKTTDKPHERLDMEKGKP